MPSVWTTARGPRRGGRSTRWGCGPAGKRLRKVHPKDFRRRVPTLDGFVDLLEGDVNWREVMQALREIGYDDYLIAEMVPQYHYAPELRAENAARALDKILAM